jgi:hypothetical protein
MKERKKITYFSTQLDYIQNKMQKFCRKNLRKKRVCSVNYNNIYAENKHFCYLQQIQQIQIGTNGNKSVQLKNKYN